MPAERAMLGVAAVSSSGQLGGQVFLGLMEMAMGPVFRFWLTRTKDTRIKTPPDLDTKKAPPGFCRRGFGLD